MTSYDASPGAGRADALPPALRSAAIEVAEQIVTRPLIPAQRGDGDEVDHAQVPFMSSIRLGRMG
jgi:hypothetical protein